MARVELVDSYSFLGDSLPYKSKRRPFDAPARWQLISVGLLAVIAVFVVAAALNVNRPQLASNSQPPATFTPAPISEQPEGEPAPVVAFIGDSYTAGTGASSQSNRWTTLLAEARGWEEANLGLGGTGYFNEGSTVTYAGVIPDAVDVAPTRVVVAGGGNDLGFGADRFVPAVDAFYTELREALPDTEIVVVSPYFRDDSDPRLPEMIAAVEAAAERVGATYLDIGQPLWDHPEYLAEDGVHPNNEGHAAIFEAVQSALD